MTDENLNIISERDLLVQVALGNEQAFRQLFDTYQSRLYNYILKITQSKETAEDTVHDVFLKLWTQKETLSQINNLNAYLYRMAHNYALNGLRRIATEVLVMKAIQKQTPLVGENPESSIEIKEINSFINNAIMNLTPQQLQVFKMSREQGLKQEEIASRLNISILTVKKHLTNALNYLRKEISNHYNSQAVALYVIFLLSR